LLPPTVSSLGEHALIARITSRLAMPPWVVVGPGDDAAVIAPERGMLDVLTTDAQIEGVHFDRTFVPADAIGHRALAVNLSDLAAMGARPRAALLSLALPGELPVEVVDGTIDGILALAASHKVALVGGNITRSPGPMMVDITAIGSVRSRRILRRAGARPGDEVYVTGRVGDAAAGLQLLQNGADASGCCAQRFLRPEPRVRAGWLLGANRAATACIDLSDGLADGVRQLADASGVGITIDERAVPVSPEATAWFAARSGDPVAAAMGGGDDYELLLTVRPTHRGRLRHVRQAAGNLPITRIGIVSKGRDVLLKAEDGSARELPGGFEHFRPSA
jgi:thiamine-monophosphate kinase